MTQRSPSTAWQQAGSSVRGDSHQRDGLPNQDALALGDPSPPVRALAAVADGHGGALHFRSADGAAFAVQSAVAVLGELARSGSSAERVAAELPQRLVERWQQHVQAHLREQPITDDEWQRLATTEGADLCAQVLVAPVLAYGATLLAALVLDDGVVLCQLGDGDILAVAAHGATHRPVPTDERLDGTATTSLCRPQAAQDCRCVVLGVHERPALLLLATDGYANSFRSEADFLQIGRDYLDLLRTHGIESLSSRLPGILAEASEQGSGDDVTLALLHDLGAASSCAVATPTQQPDEARQVEMQRLQQHLRWTRGLAAALVAALVGVVVWQAHRERSADGATESAAPAASAPKPAPADPGFALLPAPAGSGASPAGTAASAGKPPSRAASAAVVLAQPASAPPKP